MIISAASPWTGAACEQFNGVRVHFSPYRVAKRLSISDTALAETPTSVDGYISAKDSGCMLYVIALQATSKNGKTGSHP